uniref:Insulin-like domain-containing protein n=1 Tax=Strigops habroptila TaxID=2489341 RepID=A0A672UR70_STRHB
MRGAVLVLASLTLLITAQEGKGEGNTMKLCGRDFVRAIIFTCGGSRWKRHLSDYQYLFGKCSLTHYSLIAPWKACPAPGGFRTMSPAGCCPVVLWYLQCT